MATTPPPVENLPDDILRHIFGLCLPSDGTPITICPSDSHVVLTQVSRRWRRVAIDYGALWTSLKFAHTSKKVSWSAVKVQGFADRVKRSKQAPLRLLLSVVHRQRFAMDAPNLVQNLIVPFADRLTSLALKGISIRHLHGLPHGLFPQLERLAMAFNPKQISKFPWDTHGPIRAFFNAPSLRKVALKLQYPEFQRPTKFDWPVHILLPYEQLTHIMDDDDCDFANIPIVKEFLKRCPRLRYIFIPLTNEETWKERGKIRCRTERLKCLAFLSEDGSEWPLVLDQLDAPNLDRLCITSDGISDGSWSYSKEQIDVFLERLRCLQSLRCLSINSANVSCATLRSIFEATSTVETLDIAVGRRLPAVLDVLSLPDFAPTTQVILPNLRTIVIEVGGRDIPSNWTYQVFAHGPQDPNGLDLNAIRTFLSTRRHCPAENQLQKIVLYFRDKARLRVEAQPTLEVIRSFPGLELETHVVPMRDQWRYLWMDRDPELQDWKEAVEVIAGVPKPIDDRRFGVRGMSEDEIDSE